MSLSLEELSPSIIGSKLIELTLAGEESAVVVGEPVSLTVDYGNVDDNGVALPLVLTVQGTSATSYQSKTFSRELPQAITFVPREGGNHTVRLYEAAHNQLWGSITIFVDGERLQQPEVT